MTTVSDESKLMTKFHLHFSTKFFVLVLNNVEWVARYCRIAGHTAKSATKSVLSEHEQRRFFSAEQQQQQFHNTAIDAIIDSNARRLSISPMVTAIQTCAKTTVSFHTIDSIKMSLESVLHFTMFAFRFQFTDIAWLRPALRMTTMNIPSTKITTSTCNIANAYKSFPDEFRHERKRKRKCPPHRRANQEWVPLTVYTTQSETPQMCPQM